MGVISPLILSLSKDSLNEGRLGWGVISPLILSLSKDSLDGKRLGWG